MVINNPNNFPEALVRAIEGDKDRKRDANRFGVTSLVAPALIRSLEMQHSNEISADVEDMTWAMFGKAFHLLMDTYAPVNTVSEKKIELEYGGITLVGIPDIYDGKTLYDYKTTSVWSFVLGVKQEWIDQLNVYAFMLHSIGIDIEEMFIIAILRDWMARKAQTEQDYPKKPLIRVQIPFNPLSQTEDYIKKRIEAHRNVEPCTPEERWRRETTYAVKAKGVKTAKRVLPSNDEAKLWIEASGKKDLYIEERVGEDSRCLSYCNVAPWCPHNRYKEEVKDGG